MQTPVGVILAGGRGRRLGGSKATIRLDGRPLLDHPLAAMRAALTGEGEPGEEGGTPLIAVVAKPGTALPPLGPVPLWTEPAEPFHPLVGLIRALEGAAGRAVLVCPVDLPFITAETLRRLAWRPADGAPALLAARDGIVQPLLGRWEPVALAGLRSALGSGPGSGLGAGQGAAGAAEPGAGPSVGASLPAMRAVAEGLGARLTEVAAGELENVNTPADLARAQARLISRT
jgi:molybdopterin-guanine dinucleotide biosynthesis protein A